MFLSQCAQALDLGEVIYDGEFEHTGMINYAVTSKTIVFVSDPKYLKFLCGNISCVVTTKEIFENNNISEKYGVVLYDRPRDFLYMVQEYLFSIGHCLSITRSQISKTAIISRNSMISSNNVEIGERTVIEDFVVIKENVTIGNDCIIRSGTVIGTEGFEVYRDRKNNQKIAKHVGLVKIGDNVEIQANNTISKGLFKNRDTVIGEGVKTDNLVYIAHGARIGKNTRIAANAMVAGSVTIGEEVWIGPSVSVSSGVTVGEKAYITIGSVVTKDVLPGAKVTGNFAIDHEKFIQHIRSIR